MYFTSLIFLYFITEGIKIISWKSLGLNTVYNITSILFKLPFSLRNTCLSYFFFENSISLHIKLYKIFKSTLCSKWSVTSCFLKNHWRCWLHFWYKKCYRSIKNANLLMWIATFTVKKRSSQIFLDGRWY